MVEIPDDLRSHGSEHEQQVPIIGYNVKNTSHEFTENRHLGTYVIDQLGLGNGYAFVALVVTTVFSYMSLQAPKLSIL